MRISARKGLAQAENQSQFGLFRRYIRHRRHDRAAHLRRPPFGMPHAARTAGANRKNDLQFRCAIYLSSWFAEGGVYVIRQAYLSAMQWVVTLNMRDWFWVLIGCVIFGVFCMRGYGSRTSY